MSLDGVPLHDLFHKFEMLLDNGRGEFWLRQRGWNGTFFLDCDVHCSDGCNHMFSLNLNEQWQVDWEGKKDYSGQLAEEFFSEQDREQLQALLTRLYSLRAFI